MTRDELRDYIIEAKELISNLQKAWKSLEDEDIQAATETIHLPCDSCEVDKEDTNAL